MKVEISHSVVVRIVALKLLKYLLLMYGGRGRRGQDLLGASGLSRLKTTKSDWSQSHIMKTLDIILVKLDNAASGLDQSPIGSIASKQKKEKLAVASNRL